MIIGIFGREYPSQRMIIDKVSGCTYLDCERSDRIQTVLFKILGKLNGAFRASQKFDTFINFTFFPKKDCEADLFHLFNRINHGSGTWIGTFEKTFPEYSCKDSEIDLNLVLEECQFLAKDECRAILPMSEWAYEYEKNLLIKVMGQAEAEPVIQKMHIMYPPQEVYMQKEELEKKYQNIDKQELRFIFIGSQLKRKGGLIALRALNALSTKYQFEAVVIGDEDNGYNNYVLSDEEKTELHAIISDAEWLTFFKKVTNEEALEWMKRSHVGLLPTLGDTFGFSVLEMQSCACPVISTNREALSEINDENCGWTIDTRQLRLHSGDDYGNYSNEEISLLTHTIEEQLKNIIESILQHPEAIHDKAANALERIQRYHSPLEYEKKLRKLYQI